MIVNITYYVEYLRNWYVVHGGIPFSTWWYMYTEHHQKECTLHRLMISWPLTKIVQRNITIQIAQNNGFILTPNQLLKRKQTKNTLILAYPDGKKLNKKEKVYCSLNYMSSISKRVLRENELV